MGVRQAVGVALVSAAAVVGADLFMHSSLLRVLRPQVLAPADGAIVSGPVTVSWEGPQPMLAVLNGNGQRIDLGRRESPFEIDPSRFPRPGQYSLELTDPRFGTLISVDRRFMVRRATAPRVTAAAEPAPAGETPPTPNADVTGLMAERDRMRVDLAGLQTEVDTLKQQLAGSNEERDAVQADADARLAGAQVEQDALAREHLQALGENQFLRQRLQSIPPCLVWGYMAVPRPQTVPPSRFVLVSNRSGDVFRTEAQCVATRRADPTGVSPCVCVGVVWNG
ncbi:hypothetical protein KF840_23545 [bacterium]|nr:hypothetical protein [bacterium]